jgi:hypothetical protein
MHIFFRPRLFDLSDLDGRGVAWDGTRHLADRLCMDKSSLNRSHYHSSLLVPFSHIAHLATNKQSLSHTVSSIYPFQ